MKFCSIRKTHLLSFTSFHLVLLVKPGYSRAIKTKICTAVLCPLSLLLPQYIKDTKELRFVSFFLVCKALYFDTNGT